MFAAVPHMLRDLQRVTGDIAAALDGETALEAAVDGAARVLRCQTSSLFVMDWSNRTMRLAMSNIAMIEGVKLCIRGLIGEAATENRVISVVDAYADSAFDPTIDICMATRTKSMLIVPVPGHGNEAVAAVLVATNKWAVVPADHADGDSPPAVTSPTSSKFASFNEDDEFILSSIAKAAGSSLIKLRMFRHVTESEEISRKLLAVTKSLAAEISIYSTARTLLYGLRELTKASVVNLFLVQSNALEMLHLKAEEKGGFVEGQHGNSTINNDNNTLEHSIIARDRGIVGFVAKTGKVLNLSNVRAHPLFDGEVDELNMPPLPPPLLLPSRQLQQHLKRSITLLGHAATGATSEGGGAVGLAGVGSARSEGMGEMASPGTHFSASADKPSISPLLMAMSVAEAAAEDAANAEEGFEFALGVGGGAGPEGEGDVGQHGAGRVTRPLSLSRRSRAISEDELDIDDDDAVVTVVDNESATDSTLGLGQDVQAGARPAPRPLSPAVSAPALSGCWVEDPHLSDMSVSLPSLIMFPTNAVDPSPLAAAAQTLLTRTARPPKPPADPAPSVPAAGRGKAHGGAEKPPLRPPLPPPRRDPEPKAADYTMTPSPKRRRQMSVHTISSQMSIASSADSARGAYLIAGHRQLAHSMVVAPVRDQDGLIVAVIQIINKAQEHVVRRRPRASSNSDRLSEPSQIDDAAAEDANIAWVTAEAVSRSLEILLGPLPTERVQHPSPGASPGIGTDEALAMISNSDSSDLNDLRLHRRSLPSTLRKAVSTDSRKPVPQLSLLRKAGSTRHIGRVADLLAEDADSDRLASDAEQQFGGGVTSLPAWATARSFSSARSLLKHQAADQSARLSAAAVQVAQQAHSQPFTDADVAVVESLAVSAGGCFHKAMLFADITRARKKAEALLEIVRATTSEKSFFPMLQRVVAAAYHAISADKISVFLLDAPRKELWCAESKDLTGWRISLSTGIVGLVARTGEPVMLPDAYEDPRFDRTVDLRTGYRTKSICCLPVTDPRGRVLAVIEAINKLPGHIQKSDDAIASPTRLVGPESPDVQSKSRSFFNSQGAASRVPALTPTKVDGLATLFEGGSRGESSAMNAVDEGTEATSTCTSFDNDDADILRACCLEIAAALKHKSLEMLLLQGEHSVHKVARPSLGDDVLDQLRSEIQPPHLATAQSFKASGGQNASGPTTLSPEEPRPNNNPLTTAGSSASLIKPSLQSPKGVTGYVIPAVDLPHRPMSFGLSEIMSARSVGKKLMSFISTYTMKNAKGMHPDDLLDDDEVSSYGSDDEGLGDAQDVHKVVSGLRRQSRRHNSRPGTARARVSDPSPRITRLTGGHSDPHLTSSDESRNGSPIRNKSPSLRIPVPPDDSRKLLGRCNTDLSVDSGVVAVGDRLSDSFLLPRRASALAPASARSHFTDRENPIAAVLGSNDALQSDAGGPASNFKHSSVRVRQRASSMAEERHAADSGESDDEWSPAAAFLPGSPGLRAKTGSSPTLKTLHPGSDASLVNGSARSGTSNLDDARQGEIGAGLLDNRFSSSVADLLSTPDESPGADEDESTRSAARVARSSLHDRMVLRLNAARNVRDRGVTTVTEASEGASTAPSSGGQSATENFIVGTYAEQIHHILTEAPTFPSLDDWAFEVWQVPDAAVPAAILSVMHGEGLLQELRVDPHRVAKFAETVRDMYWKTISFHNHYHGLHVFQATSMLLKTTGLKAAGALPSLETFALLCAAFGHDIDHPGVSNAFLSAIEDDISLRYNDQSILENHHAALTCAIMRDDVNGTDVIHSLSPAQRRRVRQVVITAILATDMSKHFGVVVPAVKALTWPLCSVVDGAGNARPEATVLKERDKVHEIVLHAADLSGQVLPWSIASKWSDLIVEEFRAQAQLEVAAHVPLTQHMHNLDTPLECAELQSGFCDYVLAPLWRALADVFPPLVPRIEQLESNSQMYKQIVTSERAKLTSNRSGTSSTDKN